MRKLFLHRVDFYNPFSLCVINELSSPYGMLKAEIDISFKTGDDLKLCLASGGVWIARIYPER
jgi:hypothetical protein